MLRVVIVDDETPARRALRRLLRAHPQVSVAGEADSVDEAAPLVARERPDLVFLDIELGDAVGFDLLALLEPAPLVVVVTAHPEHAVDAFAVGAVDYLLKPIPPERLAAALDRARRQLARADGTAETAGRIALRTPGRTVLAREDEIAALKADGDFTRVILSDQPALMILRSLAQFEAQLPQPPFLRLSRSLIINRDRLRAIEARTRDDVRLILDGVPHPIPVGRTAAARLREVARGAAPPGKG